jgi:hypothetical protein
MKLLGNDGTLALELSELGAAGTRRMKTFS